MESVTKESFPNHEVRAEHQAWIDMCKEIQKKLGITSEEFNKDNQFRKVVTSIERWAYFDRLRRKHLANQNREEPNEKHPGVFYKGE